MNNPTVSVIITTYNRPQYLRGAMQSVLKQDLSDLELIVVDDASPGEETAGVVQSFRDPRIVYIKNETNKGSTESLNMGLRAARAAYVAILDDDDEWICVGKLKDQKAFLNAHPDYVLMGTNIVVVTYEKERELVRTHLPLDDALLRDRMLSRNPFAHSSVLYRRGAALRVGGYDPTLPRAKDFDLILKLGRVGKVAVLPGYCVMYREASFREQNLFLLRFKSSKAKWRVIWRHRREYPHAARALAIETTRLLFFSIARAFYGTGNVLLGRKGF